MLLDSHHLYAVISCSLYAREYIILELNVCTHTLALLSHAHMTLIDKQRILFGLEILMFEMIFFLWIPYLCGEYLGLIVLHHPTTPCRNTVTLTTIPLYTHLVVLPMTYHAMRNMEFPISGIVNTL